MVDLIAYVTVSIPIGLAYDRIPGKDQRWNDALANFLDHPALEDVKTLEGYVQRIEFEETPNNSICEACEGRGWILADNSDHGQRIERCDNCKRFPSDDAAVQRVADLALGAN